MLDGSLSDLSARVKTDPGAAFTADALNALAALEASDYQRIRADLKKAGCKVSELDREVARARKAGDKKDSGGGETKESQAALVLKVAEPLVELFCDENHISYARVDGDGDSKILRIEGGEFRNWVVGIYYKLTGRVASRDAVAGAQSVLSNLATTSGDVRKVFIRTGRNGNTFYLDLCDPECRVVEISDKGWRIIPGAEAPVNFRRPNSMRALPVPVSGGSVDDLLPFLNFSSDEETQLYLSAVTYGIRGRGPFPAIVITGEQGSAKSTAAIIARKVIDPASPTLRSLSKKEDDLLVAASNSWLQNFDNVSRIPEEISDVLCRLLTGGGIAKRTLYSGDDQTTIEVQRPIIFNAIPSVTDRPDLADRMVTMSCMVIPAAKRRSEADFWADFGAAHSRILGAMLDLVVEGIRNLPNVSKENLQRMADFHSWGRAVENRLGGPGSFDRAYLANRAGAISATMENDVTASAIRELLEYRGGEWSGSAAELRSDLLDRAGRLTEAKLTQDDPDASDSERRMARNKGADALARQVDFPKTPRGMSSSVKRLAPVFRAEGIETTQKSEQGHYKRSLIVFSAPSLRAYGSHTPSANRSASGDLFNSGGDPRPEPPLADGDGGGEIEVQV